VADRGRSSPCLVSAPWVARWPAVPSAMDWPTSVWDRECWRRQPKADQALRSPIVADAVTGVTMSHMVTDAAPVMAIASISACWRALPAGVVWAQIEHDRVEGPRPSARSSRAAPRCPVPRRARVGSRFPPSREADHLCLWDRRGAAYCRAFLRGNRATYGLAGDMSARLAP